MVAPLPPPPITTTNTADFLHMRWLILCMTLLFTTANGAEISQEWHVAINTNVDPVSRNQSVITINNMFPGPLLNATTLDSIHVNVYNDMDEPLLMTWNGVQQRLNSWQDGVSGTNCPIQPGTNWTYVFQLKDQIGSFFYAPSTNFQRAGGGFGPLRVNNRAVIPIPFPEPEAEFDLLIGDWYEQSYKDVRKAAYLIQPHLMLMNGKGSFLDPLAKTHENFTVSQGKTYRFRVANIGNVWSMNFRIQNHRLVIVETEGSYTNQITVDSLDIHVGQSYSVLVTADQDPADYYIVASPKWVDLVNQTSISAVGILHYDNSTMPANGPLPIGPDPFDLSFSINQAKSIRWNLTAGAARPNPQGTFNVWNVTPQETFLLYGSTANIDGLPWFAVNNVSYDAPTTPLKLADYYINGSGVYQLDIFPIHSSLNASVRGTFVVTGTHRNWLEIVFVNELNSIDSWHLDGFSFFVVGYGVGGWTPALRATYNVYDPVVRSTVQVYPGGWSAVYVYLDNPGMWNLRSQNLKHWYLGQELYIRVYDPDPNPAKERPPPENLMFCGNVVAPPPPPPPLPLPPPPATPKPFPGPERPAVPPSAGVKTSQISTWFHVVMIIWMLTLI